MVTLAFKQVLWIWWHLFLGLAAAIVVAAATTNPRNWSSSPTSQLKTPATCKSMQSRLSWILRPKLWETKSLGWPFPSSRQSMLSNRRTSAKQRDEMPVEHVVWTPANQKEMNTHHYAVSFWIWQLRQMSHTPSSLLQPTFQTISMHVELSLEVHLFRPQQPQKCNSSCQTMLIAAEFFWAFFRLLPPQHSLSFPHPASMAQQILWKNGLRSQSCPAPQRAWRSSWRLRKYFAMPASELIPRTWAWWNSRETMENQHANCWPKLLELNSPGSSEETPTAFKSMYQHGLLTCHWHAFKKPLDRCQPPVVCLRESPASNSSTNCRRQKKDMDSDYGRPNGTRSHLNWSNDNRQLDSEVQA